MKQFHCLHGQTTVYLKQNKEYGIYTLYDLFNKRRDNIIYTLNNTQEEIDISNENIYVDNNGKWTKALKIIRHKRNPDSKMIYIKSNEYYSLTMQDNHPIAISINENQYQFKEPKNIKLLNDQILISNVNIWQLGKIDSFMDGYLIGCMLGDGSITFSTKNHPNDFWPTGLKISAKKDRYDNKIRNKLIDIISNTIKTPIINDTSIIIYNRLLAQEYYKKCNRYSNRKHLPPEFIYYDDETLAKILCGLIDTDGSIKLYRNNKSYIEDISIEMNNEAIINSLMYICKKLNIKCNKFITNIIKKNEKVKFKFNYQTYILRLYPTAQNINDYLLESIKCNQYSSFERRIKNSYNYEENLFSVNNNVITDYKEIYFKDDLDEDSYVYDLETEDHQFSANGILVHNTGGAASVLYLSKEAPQLQGIINQENNDLIALKNIIIRVIEYVSDTTDIYSSKDFQVIDAETRETIDVEFSGLINFSGLMARNVKESGEDVILMYESGDMIGEIDAATTDTTNAVKTVQRILNKTNQFENGTDLVIELYDIFKNSEKIPLIHFEILASQLMRDPDKPYYPYRYGSMTKEPKMVGIKQVPGIESPKRGIMFERILDVVTNQILAPDSGKEERVKSDLELLFDI